MPPGRQRPLKTSNPFIKVESGISRLRLLSQSFFLLVSLYIGYRFYLFFLWATGKSTIFQERPPSVEGFLPLSALIGLKHLILTGVYDPVHPAGLTILLTILTIAFVFRKGFCGWICPVGAISSFLERIGRRLRWLKEPPLWLEYPLMAVKYLLMGFFIYFIFWKMDLKQIRAFIQSPYNFVADGKMLIFFLHPTDKTLIFLIALGAFCLVVRNFWCRFLCPYGALLGLFSVFSPFFVRRNSSVCLNCKLCTQRCPVAIPIHKRNSIRSPECIGCLECLEACPAEDALSLRFFHQKLPFYVLPLGLLGLFSLVLAFVRGTNLWEGQISPEAWRHIYGLFWRD
ncbi:4Fe-4S binding protein [Thermosulfuriphilus sp.]